MNTICLIGRLTADPELRTTQNQVSVTSFTLAVDRAYTPKGQEKQTDFINVVAWRNTAEIVANHFTKGRRIALTGSLQSRRYTDKEGNNRTAYEVVAESVFFCDSKPQTANVSAESSTPYSAFSGRSVEFEEIPDVDDEDVPF